jgi:hypothetical protein
MCPFLALFAFSFFLSLFFLSLFSLSVFQVGSLVLFPLLRPIEFSKTHLQQTSVKTALERSEHFTFHDQSPK